MVISLEFGLYTLKVANVIAVFNLRLCRANLTWPKVLLTEIEQIRKMKFIRVD
jgi:hypothetical protein